MNEGNCIASDCGLRPNDRSRNHAKYGYHHQYYFDVSENGQTSIVNQVTGTCARASDGTELRLMLDPKTHQPGTAILRPTARTSP